MREAIILIKSALLNKINNNNTKSKAKIMKWKSYIYIIIASYLSLPNDMSNHVSCNHFSHVYYIKYFFELVIINQPYTQILVHLIGETI